MSANKALIEKIAVPYAAAYLETAQEKKALDKISADVSDLQSMIDSSAELVSFIRSPLISRDDKVATMQALGKKAKLQTITTNFLCVLASNNRLGYLPELLGNIEGKIDAIQGNVTAEVTTAHVLTTKQTEDLKKSLKKALGSDVVVQAQVNEELLGGMIVKVGSRMIDDSVKTKLDRLSRKLTDTTGFNTNVKEA